MKWVIVADSSSDMACMKKNLDGNVAFDTVPLKLNIEGQEYVDNEDLDVDAMMKHLYEFKGKSTSAAPSPGEWKEAFDRGDNVVAITISSNLSGSCSSAKAAIHMVHDENPDKKILLIDSKSTGGAMMLIAEKALKLAHENVDFDTMQNELEIYVKTLKTLFVLENMDNLVKNGRVSKLAGSVASVLGIKVVGEGTKGGELGVLKKLRGRLQAHDKMIQCMFEKGYAGGKVKIGHCNNEEKAQYIKDKILEKFSEASVDIYTLRGLDSFYAENGGIIMGYEIA